MAKCRPSLEYLSFEHQDRQMQISARTRAAVSIQAVYRGWRTRMHVVWSVRNELNEFMFSLEQDLEMERMLLGLQKPQRSQWLLDASEPSGVGEEGQPRPKKTLHLPRIDDDVFGLSFPFPEQQPQPPVDETYQSVATRDDARSESPVSTEHGNVDHPSDKAEGELEEEMIIGVNEVDKVIVSEATAPLSSPEIPALCAPISVSQSGEMEFQEEESNSFPNTTPSLETSSQLSLEDLASSNPIEDTAHNNALTIGQILATHSKEDILLELEWAKQALRDRINYLQTRLQSREYHN